MTINVSPTIRRPTHHIKLSRSATELGLILCDARGNADAKAIERNPMPSSAIRTTGGSPTYSDEELPFMALVQENYSGGRGKLVQDDDSTRYYDGLRIDTTRAERVILGPREHYTTGFRDDYQTLINQSVSAWMPLYGANRFYSRIVSVASGMDVDHIEILVRNIGGYTGYIRAGLYSDDGAGKPDTLLQNASLLNTGLNDTQSYWLSFDITTVTMVGATDYHLVIWTNTTATASKHWEVASVAGGDGYVSADGTTWVYQDDMWPHYRLLDTGAPGAGFFFWYKGGYYHCTQPDDGTKSELYLNGDRGAADANTGVLARLVDATKAWTVNEWIDCIALITRGPGSEEVQPYRKIIGNEANYLICDPPWNVEHTTNTEYVILGSDQWQLVEDLAAFVTDYTIAGDNIYFARGDASTHKVRRYQAYNNAGTWTDRAADDVDQAIHLESVRYPDGTIYVWGSRARHANLGNAVWRGQVPITWGSLYYDLGELAPTDIPWDSTSGGIANVTQSTLQGVTRIQIADAFATGTIAMLNLTPAVDITQGTRLGLYMSSSINTAAADVDLLYSSSVDLGDTPIEISLPALVANENTWVVVDHQPLMKGPAAGGDGSAIASIGLQLDTNLGAQTIYMAYGVRILSDTLKYYPMPNDARINGLGVYAGSADNPRDNIWIQTEDQVYEVQGQNNDAIVPLPLGELKAVRHPLNGTAQTINDVYFIFNLNEKIERYYSRTMEDIGPDLDEGLPEDRQGIPSALVSYPGRVYLCMDGGDDNTSSILVYKNNGWHEIYRAPRPGLRIRAAGIQSIPGSTIKRLWFRQGADVVWLPISWNPLSDSEYTYTHEAFLETGRIYGGRRDIEKYFHSLKLATEQLAAGVTIEADYKTDTSTSWIEIPDVFDTSPYQEIDLSLDNSVTGRWIQFRLRLYTTDQTKTPVVIATILKCVVIFDVKYTYSLVFRLADNDIDLLGSVDAVTAKAKRDTLDGWVASPLPITMNSISAFEDGKVVKPSSVPLRRLKILKDKQTGKETWICQMTFLEI